MNQNVIMRKFNDKLRTFHLISNTSNCKCCIGDQKRETKFNISSKSVSYFRKVSLTPDGQYISAFHLRTTSSTQTRRTEETIRLLIFLDFFLLTCGKFTRVGSYERYNITFVLIFSKTVKWKKKCYREGLQYIERL